MGPGLWVCGGRGFLALGSGSRVPLDWLGPGSPQIFRMEGVTGRTRASPALTAGAWGQRRAFSGGGAPCASPTWPLPSRPLCLPITSVLPLSTPGPPPARTRRTGPWQSREPRSSCSGGQRSPAGPPSPPPLSPLPAALPDPRLGPSSGSHSPCHLGQASPMLQASVSQSVKWAVGAPEGSGQGWALGLTG